LCCPHNKNGESPRFHYENITPNKDKASLFQEIFFLKTKKPGDPFEGVPGGETEFSKQN
jgi:hypothetical protein